MSAGALSQRRFQVGVRLPEWAMGSTYQLFHGFHEFQSGGVAPTLRFDQPSGGDLPSEVIDADWEGDGLVVFRYTSEEAEAWNRRGLPVVSLSTEFPGFVPDFPRVTVNNSEVGRAAARHLRSLGLRDFAYIHESSRRYSAERLEAFQREVEELGGRCHVIDVPVSTFPVETRPQQIEDCLWVPLARLPRPCGVFAKDDIGAVFTIRAMGKLGIDCPGEMPVLGVSDDIVFCHLTVPAISSVAYPAKEVGFEVLKLLHRMMSGERVSGLERLMISPHPVSPRESTRKVVLPDEVVTRAMDFIRSSLATRVVKVDDVATQVGVSKELLRQRFHNVLGHSVKVEIQKQRFQQVSALLRETSLSLEEIAEKGGFASGAEVCRFVKRISGKTPGSLRGI